MWVARDKDGKIGMYDQKPRKQKDAWVADNFRESQLRGDWFPEVRWEDDEPTEITIMKKDDNMTKEEWIKERNVTNELWVARDKNGELWLYGKKPEKGDEGWYAAETYMIPLDMAKFRDFTHVEWEDDQPHRVTLVEPEWVETYVMGYLRCCVAEIGEKLYATLKAELTEKLNIASSTLWMMLDDRKEDK